MVLAIGVFFGINGIILTAVRGAGGNEGTGWLTALFMTRAGNRFVSIKGLFTPIVHPTKVRSCCETSRTQTVWSRMPAVGPHSVTSASFTWNFFSQLWCKVITRSLAFRRFEKRLFYRRLRCFTTLLGVSLDIPQFTPNCF